MYITPTFLWRRDTGDTVTTMHELDDRGIYNFPTD